VALSSRSQSSELKTLFFAGRRKTRKKVDEYMENEKDVI